MDTTDPPKNPPLKHGVVAVLEDDGGRFLFIQRGLKIKRAPGWWCFVGGEVEPGEELHAAIVREVREEVGLAVEALEKVHESISPNGEYRLHWIRVRRTCDAAVTPHAEEVNDVRWLLPAEGLALSPILPGLKSWLEKRHGLDG